ncbi:MAG: helix-turn-helix transcriptional regulator [Sphingomonadales bacterium]|nr:helix-turn-helix transcriptional regulator [Sphingomonadales bacterium]
MKNENRRQWNPDDKRFARVAQKRAQILEAAQRVFLSSGYERASMDGIAQEAGVGKMTVYRQYADKRTLFIACLNDQCQKC